MRGRDTLKETIKRRVERGWTDEEILSGVHPNILPAAIVKLRQVREQVS